MDWHRVKKTVCEGRGFQEAGDGYRVLSDTIMPSGGAIYVHLQSRTDHLMAHDGGAAFDEITRHGVEIAALRGVRGMLAKTGFNLADDGTIWRDQFAIEDAHLAIGLVADASSRAASYMLAHGRVPHGVALDQRVRDTMRARFPAGHPNYEFTGLNRQHKFDFGFMQGDKIILVQAVNPDQSSIASAIVKGLDSQAAENSNVVPIFVFDPNDHWTSGSLNMLELGGRRMEIGALKDGNLPLAA